MHFWILLTVTMKKTENLINDSDTESVDQSLVENKDVHEDMEPMKSTNGEHSNHIPTKLPIEAVVRQAIPEEESMINHSVS